MKKQKLYYVSAILFVLIFVISAVKLSVYFIEGYKAQKSFESLEQSVKPQNENISASSEREENAHHVHDYETFHEKNNDYWGWLEIKGTKLSYPVMYTPDEPEYYLDHDFEKNSSSHGVPFLDGRCTDNCKNYIIYGHHMKDKTMFSTLLSYKDKDYYENHKTITLTTKSGESTYTVIGAFYSAAYDVNDNSAFKYYNYTDLTSDDKFSDYIDKVKSNSLYDTSITAENGDSLLTLSTCSYHEKNGRFVVVAKNID